MAAEWVKAVEDGLCLSKRVYMGKDRAVTPPKPMTGMEKSTHSYLPTAPMVYAVVVDPSIVDNPDIPSYQPHVHGRCDPPALIPLQMNSIALEGDCYLDTAFVTITGSWRVHCVMGSRHCDCRIAIPMGEQGSILGVEVDVHRRSYCTRMVALDDKRVFKNEAIPKDGVFLKPHIFTFTIPQVDGGTNLVIKVRWSQKLLYHKGQFTLNVPFSFPSYVRPAGKKISKREKIHLIVNSGYETEVVFKTTSHPLKEIHRQVGKFGFLCDSEVLTWSCSDFVFSYMVPSICTFGGVLLQPAPETDIDQREMFYFYLFPGDQQGAKEFRKEVVFVVDISGSMRGQPLEDTKHALTAALIKLNPEDSFNIIAFNEKTFLFSSSLQPATKEAIESATDWINTNFIAGGGTNILLSLNQAIEMLSSTQNSLPIIFLMTDGAVEDERHICDVMRGYLTNGESIGPRIYTFGIGSFCNHYFLKMLALIGRGHSDAAYDPETIKPRMERIFARASQTILADLAIDNLDSLDEVEVHPSPIPDLLCESPLVLYGRYRGEFPETLQVRGTLSDMSTCVVKLKVREAKDIPMDKVLAKQQIELLTAQAWFTENIELMEKISHISIQSGVISEYTRMIMLEAYLERKAEESAGIKEVPNKGWQKTIDPKSQKVIVLQNACVGFGSLDATAQNISLGCDEAKPQEAAEKIAKAASNCCNNLCGRCCCFQCTYVCSRMNDQCAVLLTQLCGALMCLGCFSCCSACCSGQD